MDDYSGFESDICMSDDDPIEDEMLMYAFDDSGCSSSLRDFVQGLREERRRLNYEVRVLRLGQTDGAIMFEAVKEELKKQKQLNKKLMTEMYLRSFIWGLLCGVAIACYVMYY